MNAASLHSISIRIVLAAALALCHPAMLLAQARPDAVQLGVRVEMGDVGQVRSWLEAGLPADTLADRVGTGLMIAAWRGDLPMMELFVEHGANVNAVNALGEQALMHAAFRGNLEAVRWLLERGAQVNSRPGRWSALHYAAFGGHAEVAALLVAHGADVNARTANGSTPLMMAVYEGKDAAVKELLSRGADASLRNDRGEGALEWAFKYERLAIARMVAEPREFAAAASLPRSHWPQAVRSQPEPSPAAQAAPARAPDPIEREIADLVNRREILASHGVTKPLDAIDRRIAMLRVQKLRSDLGAPRTILLEITARRAAPRDQSSRFVTEPARR